MPSQKSAKDKSMSSHLKSLGIERNSGACPWGCGRLIANGGNHLLVHLNTCHGPMKGKKR